VIFSTHRNELCSSDGRERPLVDVVPKGGVMAITVKFEGNPTTRAKYDEVRSRLEQAGDWPAAGLVFHVAYGGSNVEGVFEVWESRDAFERFGSKLMPLLDEVGIEVEPPQVLDVYKMDSL
jgi:hypothetical protein